MAHKEKPIIGVFFSVLCIGAFASVQGSFASSAKPMYDDAEGYVVLSGLLDHYSSGPTGSVITISPTTVPVEQMLSSLNCGKVPDGFQAAIKDFQEKNKVGLQLAPKFSMQAKYELSNDPDRYLPVPKPGEQELRSPPRKPIYVVSVVGFDLSGTHAIAYISVFCGDECGGGGYHFLSKEKGAWKEIKDSPKCGWMAQGRKATDSRGLA
jgi:hypothetical protein